MTVTTADVGTIQSAQMLTCLGKQRRRYSVLNSSASTVKVSQGKVR